MPHYVDGYALHWSFSWYPQNPITVVNAVENNWQVPNKPCWLRGRHLRWSPSPKQTTIFQCFAFADWGCTSSVPATTYLIPLAPRLPASRSAICIEPPFSFGFQCISRISAIIRVNPLSNGCPVITVIWGNQIILVKSQHCSDVSSFLSDRKVSHTGNFPLFTNWAIFKSMRQFLPSYQFISSKRFLSKVRHNLAFLALFLPYYFTFLVYAVKVYG